MQYKFGNCFKLEALAREEWTSSEKYFKQTQKF